MTDRKTLCLVDLSGIWHACWHVTESQPLGEAYEMTIRKVRSVSERFDHCAICLDAPPYRRKDLHPGYKAQRDKPPENMLGQFARVQERLRADGYLLLKCDSYEADDVIATMARWGVSEGLQVEIQSNDKDLAQLVSESVAISSTMTGDRLDVAGVVGKFGVVPELLGDLLALMGDKSDNVPGVPGIGPKKAAALIQDIGPLGDILAAAVAGDERIKPAARTALTTNAAQARLASQLIELHTDLPIPCASVYEERQPESLSEPMSADAFDEPETVDAEFEDTGSSPTNEAPAAPAEAAETPPEVKPMEPIQALAKVEPVKWELALEPTSSGSAWKLAHVLYDSRQYPQFQSPEAILAVMLRGRSLGIDATTSLANFHMVEGRPTMHADLVRGLVLRSGLCEFFDFVESTDQLCTWVTKRKGASRESSLTWTIEDACAAGLVRETSPGNYSGISKSGRPSNWDKYRRTMLRHRCGVELARAVYPDITAGLYLPEELELAA